MDLAPAADQTAAQDSETELGNENAVPPKIPTLDESGENMFVPGLGWMATEEFWHLYENDVSRLPPDIDLAAVHALREDNQ